MTNELREELQKRGCNPDLIEMIEYIGILTNSEITLATAEEIIKIHENPKRYPPIGHLKQDTEGNITGGRT